MHLIKTIKTIIETAKAKAEKNHTRNHQKSIVSQKMYLSHLI
jgi:hypothetical protein